MRRTFISAFLVLVAASAFAADTQRYFVGTRMPMSDGAMVRRLYRDAESLAEPRGVMTFKYVNAFAADLTADEVRELRSSPGVRYVEPVVEVHAFGIATHQTTPYGIEAVGSRDTWVAGRGGEVNIAVIDTGVDYNHPDLKSIYAGGRNLILNTDDPMDDGTVSHGTHVSGTIAAADNGVGVVGVAPAVRLWALKVLDKTGTGRSDRTVKALEWVIDKKKAAGGNWIVNLSLGANQGSDTERAVYSRARTEGIIVVAASGNDSGRTDAVPTVAPVSFPAAYESVIAVGAIDVVRKIASFSNEGPELDIVAPGVSVLSSLRQGSGSIADITFSGNTYVGTSLTGSPLGSSSGELVYCGLGKPDEFPVSVKGNVALIRRGELRFYEKVRNAKAAGATAAVIFNDDDTKSLSGWTMEPATGETAVNLSAVGIERVSGEAMKQNGPVSVVADGNDDYGFLDGTSMSCPHVVGAIALVWSLAPTATAEQVINSIIVTARDLGTPGFDPTYGHGAINAFDAAKLLAPNAFGSAANPTTSKPTTGRGLGRRG